MHPSELFLTLNVLRGTLKNIMSPVHRSFADPYGKIIVFRENPAKIPVWQKIRQSIPLLIKFNRATAGGTVNLHASQFRLKQRKVSSHPPSPICPFPISPSLSLPLQTLRLVSLVSLITKSKRIADRSDTNCDPHTHTHTHTHRQSTLGKYMVNFLEI
jgi:hypothetical protein